MAVRSGASLHKVDPDEIYNLGAQSHVKVSFDQAEYTADVVATGTLRLLEALRDYCAVTKRDVRMYQAGSSEMFGAASPPQNESTAFYPRSPYAVAKVAAYWYCVNYREAYSLFISNGLLFNHESPLRGETFVTRKITRAVGKISVGLQREALSGQSGSAQGLGFRGRLRGCDVADAAAGIARRFCGCDRPCVFSRDFVEAAFAHAGLNWEAFVEIDQRYMRPTEVDFLLGDPSKAKRKLGWTAAGEVR